MIPITRRQFLFGAGAVAVLPPGLGAYAVGIEPMLAPRRTSYRPAPPRWPDRIGLRIAVVADLHACEPWMSAERIASIAAVTNRLQADLIVLLGDFNAGHRFVTAPVRPAVWADALSSLRAPLGVYAILGNHDWWHGPVPGMPGGPAEVRTALQAVGIPVLENAAIPLTKDGRRFWLAGLADQQRHYNRHIYRLGSEDIDRTLRQARADEPVILLVHEPFIFPRVPSHVAITLCGHTHGGQVDLPILGRPFGEGPYQYGHFVESDRHLIVSGGLGESGAPVRIGVPPEIVLVELGHPAVAS